MLKKIVLLIGVLISVYIGITFLHFANQPKPINWSINLKSFNQDPFGCYVLFKELEHVFPEQKVLRLNEDELWQYYNNSSADSLNFLIEQIERRQSNGFVNLDQRAKDTFNYLGVDLRLSGSEYALSGLVKHIEKGNVAQLFAFSMPYQLAEALRFKTSVVDSLNLSAEELKANFELRSEGQSYSIKPYRYFHYFSDYQSNAEVIIESKSKKALGLKYKLGEGELYLYTIPTVLSNYELLYGERSLSESLLSNFSDGPIHWSQTLDFKNDFEDRSLLSFIHSQPSLKFAYYLLLIGVLVFLFLRVFRQQRAIKEHQAPQNLSLSFVKTISGLHQSRSDYRAILQKKMHFLMHEIKLRFRLETAKVDDEFIYHLAKKSGVKEARIKALFKDYEYLIKADIINEREFFSLCSKFQFFKDKLHGERPRSK
ncbi:MAG: hypothetical protein RIC95_04545 [Vicingaceae bacterium]